MTTVKCNVCITVQYCVAYLLDSASAIDVE